jgi:beta-glucosidase
MGVKEHGEAFMRKRFEQSAVRLLRNIFNTGLFENPYLDPAVTRNIVGNPEFMKAGYEAQLKSVVMLKNKGNVLPVKKGKTVYVPKRVFPAARDWFGSVTPEKIDYPVNIDIIRKYYTVTDDPAAADFAIVFVNSPNSGVGYDIKDKENGGNGYVPISLQYGAYTAEFAREKSIAAGDPVEPGIDNRSYKGKTITATNVTDLKSILDTKVAMKGKPVVVSLALSLPMVMGEFEKDADGIIAGFGLQAQAILDIISGTAEPSGLLPLQMPADMKTVELQKEDVPHDMQPYKDSEGQVYDFGYGMNWKGVISDHRNATYKKKK